MCFQAFDMSIFELLGTIIKCLCIQYKYFYVATFNVSERCIKLALYMYVYVLDKSCIELLNYHVSIKEELVRRCLCCIKKNPISLIIK